MKPTDYATQRSIAQRWTKSPDALKREVDPPKIKDIKTAVAEYFDITVADIDGPRRFQRIARPRQIAFYLSRIHTGRSFEAIGFHIGKRDHTTVMYGINEQIAPAIKAGDFETVEAIDAIEAALGLRKIENSKEGMKL